MAHKKKTPSAKKSAKKSTKKSAGKSTRLGRPRIPGTAELDMFFKRDFEARQIFQFLDVGTVKELEQFSPEEITDRMITPLVQAVERIRKTLALANRHLDGDVKFAERFQTELSGGK